MPHVSPLSHYLDYNRMKESYIKTPTSHGSTAQVWRKENCTCLIHIALPTLTTIANPKQCIRKEVNHQHSSIFYLL